MNKSKFLAFILLAALTLGFSACGSDEPDEPKLAAPAVVSTSPEKGSTTVVPGAISVTITYDKTIAMTASDISKIQATGATISNVRTMRTDLMLTATCAEEGKAVTITIPAGVIKNTDGVAAAAYTLTFTTKKIELPDPVAPDGHESAAQAVLNMTPGWNLGNTLDSYGAWIGDHQEPYKYETAWGQPITDAHLMQAFKEKGFKGIRVPVTWFQHMDDQGNVDEAWMNRVQEVVDYVINQGPTMPHGLSPARRCNSTAMPSCGHRLPPASRTTTNICCLKAITRCSTLPSNGTSRAICPISST